MASESERQEITLLLQTRLFLRKTTEAIIYAEGGRADRNNASAGYDSRRRAVADSVSFAATFSLLCAQCRLSLASSLRLFPTKLRFAGPLFAAVRPLFLLVRVYG